jgi:hypothetical protein
MKGFTPTILLIPVCALSFGVADAADPPAAPDVMTAHFLPQGPSNARLPPAGLGSLYWAARHPAQAWRVLLPIQDGSIANADIGVKCTATTNGPGGRAACK